MGLQPTHTLSASEMRYSLETPFVRSAAENAWGYSRPTPSALRRCATTRNESVVKKIFRLIFYCIFSKQTLQLVIEAFSKMMLLLITNIIAYHIPVSERISQRTVLFCPSFEKRKILIVVTKKLAGLHLNHPHKFRDRYRRRQLNEHMYMVWHTTYTVQLTILIAHNTPNIIV